MSIAESHTPQPLAVLRPSRGWAALNLREVWQFRDLLLTLAFRDVKLRYRQTALGVVWVLVQPLLAAGIFSVVFGRIGKFSSDGLPYFLFAFANQLAWSLFSGTLTRSSNCLVQNAALVSKVFFPRLILPLSTVFSGILDFGVGMIMLMVMLLFNGIYPGIALLTFPLWMILVLALALGVGLFAAALTVSYRDVQYVLPVVIPLFMYATPVAYAVSAVPATLRPYFLLNPLASLVEGMRWSLTGTGKLQTPYVIYSVAFSLGILILGNGGLPADGAEICRCHLNRAPKSFAAGSKPLESVSDRPKRRNGYDPCGGVRRPSAEPAAQNAAGHLLGNPGCFL